MNLPRAVLIREEDIMKNKCRFRRFSVISAVLLVLLMLGSFKVYAFPNSFINHWLSSSGDVKASYNAITNVITISGAGTVEYDRWITMAQRINPDYFASKIAWDERTSEETMKMVFVGKPKAIKLCGTEKYGNGLFAGFSGKIRFNDAVDLDSNVTNTSFMFAATPQFNEEVDFDTSNVNNMAGMFVGATAFNQSVNFDTHNVTNMHAMFKRANKFNHSVDFDTQKVKNMRSMFERAEAFNQSVNFDTRNVRDMSFMFSDARVFDQSVNFDTRNVKNMHAMFRRADRFNHSVDFDTQKVKNMRSMFEDAEAFNQSVNFDTRNVTDMSFMFSGASVFDQSVNFDTRNVTNMRAMFRLAGEFNHPVVFDTQKVKNMHSMFERAEVFNQSVNFDTRNVTDMSFMFSSASVFDQPVKLKTQNVTNMRGMFWEAEAFNQSINFDTRNVTNMSYMFMEASSFNQPVNFDTGKVVNMNAMFRAATSFNYPVDFDTSHVTDMAFMFDKTIAFKQPIFFDISSLQRMQYMFRDSAVEQVILRNYANHQNIAANHAFKNCANLYYLSFKGLKNASIDGFSGDYYVEENGANGTLTPRHDYQGFSFADNKRYRVFLQSSSSAYSGFKLSADGKVLADYNGTTKKLSIYGAGVVKYDGWVAMARLTNARYYGFNNSWDYQISEDDMTIVFTGQQKAIKLCGTEKARNGLFTSFSGKIYLNDVVDLAPDVTDLSYMFKEAKQFNEPVDFDTSNVTTMEEMFDNAITFNQPVKFNTSNVKSMRYMFSSAASFNQPVNFDTRKVTNMTGVFQNASNFNQPVNFDTRKVKDFSTMFSYATSFNHPIFFNISSAKDMSFMFSNSKVERVLFENSTKQEDINADHIFDDCHHLKHIQFSGLIHAKVDGFSGDYYVEENGGQPTAHNATDQYVFSDNLAYRVYLMYSKQPKVSVYKNSKNITVKWTPVYGASGYEVYRAFDKNGPFKMVNSTSALSYTDIYSIISLRRTVYYYKVRAYRFKGGLKEYGPFSDVVTWIDILSPPIRNGVDLLPLD